VHERNPSARVDVLARFDEMLEPFEKASVTGSTLESKLLQMYERNSVSQASFKNGEHEVQGLHFSLTGDFTLDNFERAFAGRGSGGSGFLARCVYSYSQRMTHNGDWAKIDHRAGLKALKDITNCIQSLPSNPDQPLLFGDPEEPIGHQFIPEETVAAKAMRLEFFEALNKEDERFVPELEAHFKRDLLMRAVFSPHKVIDEINTGKSILWTRQQLEIRKLLWPEDAGNPIEQFERKIMKALTGRSLTMARLLDFCNVNRAGSGGRNTFLQSLKALTTSGDILVAGRTRKGTVVYASRITVESPSADLRDS
jgi:hypothetical protein